MKITFNLHLYLALFLVIFSFSSATALAAVRRTPSRPTATVTIAPTVTITTTNAATTAAITTANPTIASTLSLNSTASPTPPAGLTRTTKYFLADRVINNADFAKLAGWGINTAMVDFDVNGSATTWKAVFQAAKNAGINIVIWPSDWSSSKRPNCDWEAPFPVSTNGDITKVKPLLDVASTYSNFIGIINGHESFWSCTNMTFSEMAGLKTQLKAYALSKGKEIKVWNYINGLYSETGSPAFPASQISKIMDVAIVWKHCAGSAEGKCESTTNLADKSTTYGQILSDRARLTTAGLDGTVELVFVQDTFTSSSPYTAKFSLDELEKYSCDFLGTNALDGFGFYTWDAGWWGDLHSWTDLQPAVKFIRDTCTKPAGSNVTPTLSPTITPTLTTTPTLSPTITPTTTPLPPKLGDANGDKVVDERDYTVWKYNFRLLSGATFAKGDFNKDGKVDGVDYVIWLNYYGL